jgi:hypothetical protein
MLALYLDRQALIQHIVLQHKAHRQLLLLLQSQIMLLPHLDRQALIQHIVLQHKAHNQLLLLLLLLHLQIMLPPHLDSQALIQHIVLQHEAHSAPGGLGEGGTVHLHCSNAATAAGKDSRHQITSYCSKPTAATTLLWGVQDPCAEYHCSYVHCGDGQLSAWPTCQQFVQLRRTGKPDN